MTDMPTLSRRSLIGGALLAAGWAALPSGTASAQVTVPDTLSELGGVTGRPGFRVNHLGVVWNGAESGGRYRVRTRGGWSVWRPLAAGCQAAADRPSSAPRSVLLPVGAADEFVVEPAAGTGDVRTMAINVTDGPRRLAAAAPPRSGFPLPDGRRVSGVQYRSRAGWGADESLRFGPGGVDRFPPEYHPVQTLTVHHTVTANNDRDPAGTVRAIYRFHTIDRDFGDIGYHLLVDQAGVVYEGRHSGTDGVPAFGGRPGKPYLVNTAAHTGGFNSGNLGVALLGDLTGTGPTAAARRALVRVLAGLASVTGVNPTGQVDYVNPVSGARKRVAAIAAHRDWLPTECPGNAFYPTLPALRREVAATRG